MNINVTIIGNRFIVGNFKHKITFIGVKSVAVVSYGIYYKRIGFYLIIRKRANSNFSFHA